MNNTFFTTPFCRADAYKLSHWRQFPEDVNYIYSNFTPRYTLLGDDVKHVVVFGIRAFCYKLIDTFDECFFSQSQQTAINDYVEFFTAFMGVSPSEDDIQRVSDLWKLRTLPLEIHCVPEGSFVPHGVPVLTIENTVPGFHWLVGWVESWMSSELWHPMTSATTASMYRIQFDKYANLTSEQDFMPKFQGHDFSFRGQTCLEAATVSGAAHALFFTGSDTCPSLSWIMDNYNESMSELPKELIITSVAATEHSVMAAGGELSEIDTISRLLDLHPTGILSVVSDTWDFWGVVTEILPQLKHRIMTRDGKYVVRPDSGDPVKIICGDPEAEVGTPEYYGLIEVLGNIFGYTVNSKGYKQLDSHIGAIYGDSITLARQKEILKRLEDEGWSSTNIVLGIGSYCVHPDTKILCADLTWKRAGDLIAGEEIMAFDEDPTFDAGRKAARQYKTATIVVNNPGVKLSTTIETDIGNPITASDDHPWLVFSKNRNRKRVFFGKTVDTQTRMPRSAGLEWKTTSELCEGDQLAFFGNPWEVETTFDAGWLSGMFDGEGSYSKDSSSHRSIAAWKINISQNKGDILDKLKTLFNHYKFTYYMNERKCSQVVITGGWYEHLRLLGMFRPQRLLNKTIEAFRNGPALISGRTYKLATITKLTPRGNQDIASIQTSTGTFITEGYLSHNTYQYVTRDTHGFAMKATAVGKTDGTYMPIFKAPKTDSGKNSAKGFLSVYMDPHECMWKCQQNVPFEQRHGQMGCILRDGDVLEEETFEDIRKRAEIWLADAVDEA